MAQGNASRCGTEYVGLEDIVAPYHDPPFGVTRFEASAR
jgi:hypothetical protein